MNDTTILNKFEDLKLKGAKQDYIHQMMLIIIAKL